MQVEQYYSKIHWQNFSNTYEHLNLTFIYYLKRSWDTEKFWNCWGFKQPSLLTQNFCLFVVIIVYYKITAHHYILSLLLTIQHKNDKSRFLSKHTLVSLCFIMYDMINKLVVNRICEPQFSFWDSIFREIQESDLVCSGNVQLKACRLVKGRFLNFHEHAT